MTQTAAVAIDVRWRATDAAGAWSAPQRYGLAEAITVQGLDRAKSYDFQVRSVSSCGATSGWVPAAHVVSSALLLPGDIASLSAQSLADGVHLDWTVAIFQPSNVEFSVERAAAAAGPFTERTRVRTLGYTDPETTGTVYYYRVRAVTYSGIFGSYSDVINSNGVDVSAIKDNAGAANANVPTVLNPQFKDGANGWTLGPGWTVSDFPRATRTGTGAPVTSGIVNAELVPVNPGDQIKLTAVITASGADGSCAAAVYWYDANLNPLATPYTLATGFSVVTGTALNTVSQLVAVAPANVAFTASGAVASNHANGTYTADMFRLSTPLSSLDELPDGTSKFGAIVNPATQATQAAQIAASYQPGQNIVPNPSIAIGCDQNNPLGWNLANGTSTTSSCVRNINGLATALQIVTTAAAPVTVTCYSDYFPMPGSGVISAQCRYDIDRTYDAGDASSDIEFVQLAGGAYQHLAYSARIFTAGANTDAPVVAQLQNQAIPANTTHARIRTFIEGAQGQAGLPVYLRITDYKIEVGATCTPFSDYASQYGNNLAVQGSAQQLGDQRNLPSSISRNMGMVRSATALTAASTGAVSVNAHTVTLGAALIAYNAKSNAVVGLAVGGTYWIYTHDNYAGGSPACLATTSAATANSYDDAYNMGQVTIPSSGTSGGGGPGGNNGGDCVGADMWLRPGLTAGDLARRWRWWKPWLWFLRGHDGWHLIRRRPYILREPSVRVIAAGGEYVDCSVSTPVDTATGESVYAPAMYGHGIATERNGWQLVADVQDRGLREVVRINLGGHSFFAGANARARLSTHNWTK